MTKTNTINFDWVNSTPQDIQNLKAVIEKSIEDQKTFFNNLDKKTLTFENVMVSFDRFSYVRHQVMGQFFGFVNLSKNEQVRDTARKVEIEISSIMQSFAYDKSIYAVFSLYYNQFYKKEKKSLTQEQIKIVEDSNKSYKQMGMHLDDKTKQKLLKKKTELNQLESNFDELCTKNFQKGLWFTLSELKGVPESSLKSLNTREGGETEYFVRILPTEALNLMKYCEISKTREKMCKLVEESVGDVNTKCFIKILRLRKEITDILGFKTFSHLVMDEEMVNDPEKAKAFLSKVIKSISKEYNKELDKINIFAKSHGDSLTTASSPFYANLLRKTELNIDEQLYKPYFELDNVMTVIFKIWHDIFGLRNVKTEVPSFDQSQMSYKFFELETDRLLGYAFFDLFPRAGKYGHACVADYLKKTTIKDTDGNPTRSVGATYLVCNFAKNRDGKTLLSFNDVNTLFHECGHMLHDILMKNNYLASSQTSRDFVEIPSQFFENFLYNEKFVKDNFKHYETGTDMPKDLLKKISKVNRREEAATWTKVSATAMFDLDLHGKNILKFKTPKQIDDLFEFYWKKNVKIPTKNKRHYLSGFAHLVGGYESRYCSYVISRVYAQDFWEEFSKGGLKKSKISDKYKTFLEKANTEKESKLVKDFLGRQVKDKAFLKYVSVR